MKQISRGILKKAVLLGVVCGGMLNCSSGWAEDYTVTIKSSGTISSPANPTTFTLGTNGKGVTGGNMQGSNERITSIETQGASVSVVYCIRLNSTTTSSSIVMADGKLIANIESKDNCGIYFAGGDNSKFEVMNVKRITVGVNGGTVTSGIAYGIWSSAGVNVVTFTGSDSSITAKSSTAAYGIYATGGSLTVTPAEGGTTISASGGTGSYAVWVKTGANVTIGGQDRSVTLIGNVKNEGTLNMTGVVDIKGNASDSTIQLGNGTINSKSDSSMKVYGGYSESGAVSNNTVTFSGSTVTGATAAGKGAYIYGGYSTAATGNITGNSMTINGAVVSNVQRIYAGFSGKSGATTSVNLTSNILTIKSGSTVTGVAGGMRIAGAQNVNQNNAGGTSMNANSVVINGGTVENVKEMFGGLSFTTNTAVTNNVVTISGGSIAGISDGMILRAGNGSGTSVASNSVGITAGILTGLKELHGGFGSSSGTSVTGNVVTISGGSIAGVTDGMRIRGGEGSGSSVGGNTVSDGNRVEINGGELTGVRSVLGGYGNTAASSTAVTYNVISISAGSATGISTGMTIRGGEGSGTNVANNQVTIIGGTLSHVGSILGGFGNASATSVTGNVISISNGSVIGADCGMTLRGGEGRTTVSGNGVTITGGTFSGLQSVFGGYQQRYTTGGTAANNSVTIGENVTVSGASEVDNKISVAGGYARGESSSATGNTVTILTGTYEKDIYGGYARFGAATGNRVNLSGGTYKGNICAGYGTSSSDNTIAITGTGAVYLGINGIITADAAVKLGNGTDDAMFTVGDGTNFTILTFSSGLNVTAKSTLDIKNNAVVKLQKGGTGAGTLNSAGTFDMSEGAVDTFTIGTLTGTTNLKIDVDMNTLIGDKLAVGTVTGATINLSSINITADIAGAGTEDKKIKYVTNSDGSSTVKSGGTYTINGTEEGEQVVWTNAYKYTFAKGTADGTLNYKAVALTSAVPMPKLTGAAPGVPFFTSAVPDTIFKDFIESEQTATLCLTKDMNDDTANMGAATLNIHVNGHILGTTVGNIVTMGANTMNIAGGTTQGRVYTGWTLAEGGELNTSGLLDMRGTLSGDGTLTNSGTLDIAAADLGLNTINTGTINLGAGTLSKAVVGGTIKIIDNVTAAANYVAGVTNVVAENKTLTLTDGVLVGDLLGAGNIVVAGSVRGDASKFAQEGKLEVVNTLAFTGGQLKLKNKGEFIQRVDSEVVLPVELIETDINDANKAMFMEIEDAKKFDVSSGKLILTGNIQEGKYYALAAGTAVNADFVDNKLWQMDNIHAADVMMAEFEYAVNTTDKSAAVMATNVVTHDEGNTSGLAGVQQGNITVAKEFTSEVEKHLGLAAKPELVERPKYDKEVWASYLRTKEKTAGMKLGRIEGNNIAQYNGYVVGVDFYSSRKSIAGLALSYSTGDIESISKVTFTRNKSKYYGVSFYDRVINGNIALIYDIGYVRGNNEIGQYSNGKKITADVRTDIYTAGIRYEASLGTAKSRVVPFASFRYLRQNNKDYTNSHNTRFVNGNQNLYVPKIGIAWTGDFAMAASGWNWKPAVEAGYIWNLGDRNVYGNVSAGGSRVGIEYDTVDRSAYYAKAGTEFSKKNFSVGISYRYLKGDTASNNTWNINLGWSF